VYLHTLANRLAPCDNGPCCVAGGEDEANADLDFNAVQRGGAARHFKHADTYQVSHHCSLGLSLSSLTRAHTRSPTHALTHSLELLLLVSLIAHSVHDSSTHSCAPLTLTPLAHRMTLEFGDAEMSNKLNRVVKACVELQGANPILSIHDQGAGGNCNVVKELIYPKVRPHRYVHNVYGYTYTDMGTDVYTDACKDINTDADADTLATSFTAL